MGYLCSLFDFLNLPSGDAGPIAYNSQRQTAELLEAAFDVLTLLTLKIIKGELRRGDSIESRCFTTPPGYSASIQAR